MSGPEGNLPPDPQLYHALLERATDLVAIVEVDGMMRYASPSFLRILGYAPHKILGTNVFTLVHPDDMTRVQDAYTGAANCHEPVTVECRYRHASGAWRVIEATASNHLDDPVVCGFVVNGRDVTERVEAYASLEHRVAERTHELSTLLDVSHNVASTLELQPLLALILDQLKSVVEYRDASILVTEGDELEILAYWGPVEAEQLVGRRFALARAAANRHVIARKEPLIVADLWAADPMARAFHRVATTDLGAPMEHMRAWIGVPLLLKDGIIGMLSLGYDEPGYYTSRHAALALAIANQAAAAIDNARLYERAQEVAALEERQRLARELHDSVSQALYGIALGVRTARALLDHDPGRAVEPLDYVLTLADAGLTEMRALIFELRPEALAAEGLVAALEKQIDFVRARHGITVHAALDGEPMIAYAVKEALYRIAQEALHNTVKHARARHVEITLRQAVGELVLEVCDDGAGFDPDHLFPGHMGLETMRERAARLKGTLDISSAPGHGTAIRARIPALGANVGRIIATP